MNKRLRGIGFVIIERKMKFLIVWLLVTVTVTVVTVVNVTYDHRPLVIEDKRRVLVSGSIHYPRSTPNVSVDDKQCGHGLYRNLRMVDWNFHEPVRGHVYFLYIYLFVCLFIYYDFSRILKEVAEHNTPKD
ncbi:putative beta-galactosidase [Helianthus anomalus]